ncbi:MAG TPA: 1-deoxy-D-xylulose-5-phosphate reductoisomerase [Aquifex aeolicus]|nr:1-deoxy-D-xylulose-5-phosphate reductoisomerase [Aquifex aeolicus]
MESIAVLGSTGSVGTQTLEVIEKFPKRFKVCLLSARKTSSKLLSQVKKFNPSYVVTQEPPPKEWLRELPQGVRHLSGNLGLAIALEKAKPPKVVNAISGIFGIEPSFLVLENTDAKLLLANKETVIAGGEFLKPYLKRIIPIDSEHNALFQLLENIPKKSIRKIYLTASGGPFRGKTLEELKRVKPEDALKHPRWKMGAKITVDSATLMNKGFEVIEAHYLFDFPIEDIQVLIHPQSVVHAIVETTDGNMFALLSPTDMKFPIQHALFYPERSITPFKGLNLPSIGRLEFEKPDTETFKCLKLAYSYGEKGLPYTALLVGADEGAVKLFLEKKISFTDIPELIEATVEKLAPKWRNMERKDIPKVVNLAYRETLKVVKS